MNDPKLWVLIALGAVTAVFLYVMLARIAGRDPARETAIGFGTNFFDTLGIGSYAPTTVLFRRFRLVPDERIPGTMTVGHALPTITQAFIYISIVKVEATTLVVLILASILGSWLGAGIVSGWPKRKIQLGMGLALMAAGLLFVFRNLDATRVQPVLAGGNALGLDGALLVAGILGNFVLGALMTLGIGLYAPCTIMISLLGMDPIAAFPIMMGSCAFLMPIASLRFMKAEAFSVRPALGLTLGGIPAVLIAAFIVKSMSPVAVRWLVVVVVLIAAFGLLRAAFGARPQSPSGVPTP